LYIEIVEKITGEIVPGLLHDEGSRKITVFIYNVFFGFGTTVLLYSGAMSGTNDSVMEYAEVDGTNYWQKFIYVLFPMIFPTFITFMVMHISDTFMNQMNLLGFWADTAPPKLKTIGYFLYTSTLKASLTEYPLLATYGLIFTVVTMPVVFIVKHLLEKYGPNAY
jgi:ABC-type sugar transport system permease subunit